MKRNEQEPTFDELMQRIANGRQDIDIDDFEQRLGLPADWTWEDLRDMPVAELLFYIRAGLV